MSLFFETIQVFDGQPQRLALHVERMENTRAMLLGIYKPVKLVGLLNIPQEYTTGNVKCRIDYDKEINRISFELYKPRNIRRLRLVDGGNIEYNFKYSDRSRLLQLLEADTSADEILIVKNGYISDTSFSNIAFSNGSDWFTPEKPLLLGTRRRALIQEGMLIPIPIRVKDMRQFNTAVLINSMLGLDESPKIDIRLIRD